MVRTLSEVKNSPGIPGLFWIQGGGLVDGFCSDYDANKPSACRAALHGLATPIGMEMSRGPHTAEIQP
jgi:hypothetical protein